LGIGDWGLGIGPNPQSPIPIPNPHKGIFEIKLLNKYSKYNITNRLINKRKYKN